MLSGSLMTIIVDGNHTDEACSARSLAYVIYVRSEQIRDAS